MTHRRETAGVHELRGSIAGTRTRLLETRGEGPALLLLHGFSDSADTWRPLLERLAARGIRACAPDLPGFGAAADARPGPVLPQLTGMIAGAAWRVSGEYAEPVAIVGNSMGGMLALYMANNRHDVALAGIVPVATAGLHHPAWIRMISSPLARPIVPLLATAPLRPLLSLGMARFGATLRSGDVVRHAPRYVSHLTRDRVRHQLSIVERLLAEEDYPLDVARIDCPVLFVWGERDRAARYERNRERIANLMGRIAQAEQATLPHCGHTPQLEDPDALLRLILAAAPPAPSASRARSSR